MQYSKYLNNKRGNQTFTFQIFANPCFNGICSMSLATEEEKQKLLS